MGWLYDLGIAFYGLILRVIAPFHSKARRWVDGRKGLLDHIKQTVESDVKHIWFHYASLGEFEQGRSVMEQIKKRFPGEKIIVTFFSPSGYDIRKNTNLADYVFYLPTDSASHARQFLDIIQPKLAIFTKYEYWYHYFTELDRRNVRLLMISAIFRPDQLFFKTYGGFYRSILKRVSFFFAQNMNSVYLLKSIGLTNAGLAGDTRFDRVVELPKYSANIAGVEQFVGRRNVLIGGSTWLPDEQRLQELAGQYRTWKFILAPHEIHAARLKEIEELFPGALRFSMFSTYNDEQIEQAQTLIIDNIGMLSSLYHYGDLAYIGGGFGAGIHNTLEAATYGIPVIFGPKYEKFQEAIDLIELGAGFSISNTDELLTVFASLQQLDIRESSGRAAANYVQQRAGATQIIMKYLETEGLLG